MVKLVLQLLMSLLAEEDAAGVEDSLNPVLLDVNLALEVEGLTTVHEDTHQNSDPICQLVLVLAHLGDGDIVSVELTHWRSAQIDLHDHFEWRCGGRSEYHMVSLDDRAKSEYGKVFELGLEGVENLLARVVIHGSAKQFFHCLTVLLALGWAIAASVPVIRLRHVDKRESLFRGQIDVFDQEHAGGRVFENLG